MKKLYKGHLVNEIECPKGDDGRYHFLYKVINNVNGKYYWGVHNCIKINDGYCGGGLALQKAFVKYGKNNFIFIVQEFFSSKEEAFDQEAKIVTPIEISNPMCYNECVGGGGTYNIVKDTVVVTDGQTRFRVRTDDPRYLAGELVSVNKGRTRSKETRDKISQSQIAKYVSPETRSKISIALKGRSKNKESIEFMKSHHTKPWLGKHHTIEQCKKISSANKGVKKTNETRKKISESHMNKHLSQEHKQHISESQYKPIRCVETLTIYKSIQDATYDIRGIYNTSSICACLKGRQKTAYGYHWEYL